MCPRHTAFTQYRSKHIHWIQMYYTSTFSLPWTLSKVQALIRTAFQVYTNRYRRDWNISFCLAIGLEWFIRYEETVGKEKSSSINGNERAFVTFTLARLYMSSRYRRECEETASPGVSTFRARASKTVNTENTEKRCKNSSRNIHFALKMFTCSNKCHKIGPQHVLIKLFLAPDMTFYD